MKIWKHEKHVARLFVTHARTVESCLRAAEAGLLAYLEGAAITPAAESVSRLESDADELTREARDVLYKGAFLPMLREDLYELLATVDDVANAAETAIQFVQRQRPAIPNDLVAVFRELIEASMTTIAPLAESLDTFFKPRGKIQSVREHVREVSGGESVADEVENRLTHDVFVSSLTLAEKMHLRDFIQVIVQVSDRAENAADRLEQVSLQSLV